MNFVNSDFNIPISDRLYESLLHSNYPKISLFIESVKFCKFYSLEKTKMDDPYTHIPYIKRYVNLFDYGAIPYTLPKIKIENYNWFIKKQLCWCGEIFSMFWSFDIPILHLHCFSSLSYPVPRIVYSAYANVSSKYRPFSIYSFLRFLKVFVYTIDICVCGVCTEQCIQWVLFQFIVPVSHLACFAWYVFAEREMNSTRKKTNSNSHFYFLFDLILS